MKKKIYNSLLSLLLLMGLKTYAQLDLKFNASGLANKKLEISTEIGADKLGLDFNFGYTFKPWGDGVSINDQDISIPRTGFLLGFKPNYYFRPKTSMDGFYLAPYINYLRQTLKYDSGNKVNHNRMTSGLLLGRKGMINDSFGYLIEMGAGYNFLYNYKNKATGEKEFLEESIPLLGNLTKIALPLRISVFYRIQERY